MHPGGTVCVVQAYSLLLSGIMSPSQNHFADVSRWEGGGLHFILKQESQSRQTKSPNTFAQSTLTRSPGQAAALFVEAAGAFGTRGDDSDVLFGKNTVDLVASFVIGKQAS